MLINGHYYSDKHPLIPLIGVPIYSSIKAISYLFGLGDSSILNDGYVVNFRDNNGEALIFQDIYLSWIHSMSMFIVVALLSCLPAALSIIILYRILKQFTRTENTRLWVTATYALGTLAFPYSLLFFGYSLSSFFYLISFYLIFTSKKTKWNLVLSGILMGFSFTSDSTFLLAIIPLFFYVLVKYRVKTAYFLLGFLVTMIPLYLFYYSIVKGEALVPHKQMYEMDIWGDYFTTVNSKEFLDSKTVIPLFQEKKIVLDFWIVIHSLFYPYRGIFFYYPVLLFSILGLVHMRKKYRAYMHILLFQLALALLVISSFNLFWHGNIFGLRYFYPLMLLLMIPLAIAFDNISSGYRNVFYLFVFVSIFTNVLGLQNFENEISSGEGILATPENSINLRDYFYNPLLEHYLPLTLANGPRSRLIENLLDFDGGLDIRDVPYSKGVLSSPYVRKEYVHLATVSGFGFLV
ncbi:MAG: glycosyltransferase family 39 protein, partial [Candidatus Altiarchaeota archaeon]|nr:glycosyltransferase family 39 protein [Candidatus Altiarchaeota archaeon]